MTDLNSPGAIIDTVDKMRALVPFTKMKDRYGDIGMWDGSWVHYPETVELTPERVVKKYGPLTVVAFSQPSVDVDAICTDHGNWDAGGYCNNLILINGEADTCGYRQPLPADELDLTPTSVSDLIDALLRACRESADTMSTTEVLAYAERIRAAHTETTLSPTEIRERATQVAYAQIAEARHFTAQYVDEHLERAEVPEMFRAEAQARALPYVRALTGMEFPAQEEAA